MGPPFRVVDDDVTNQGKISVLGGVVRGGHMGPPLRAGMPDCDD